VYVGGCVHIYMHAIYIYINLLNLQYIYILFTYIHTYIHTYTYTYILLGCYITYVHTYIHILGIGDSTERSPYSGISSPEEEVGTNNAQRLTQETGAQGALLSTGDQVLSPSGLFLFF
jgi:hypothetical protein